MTGDEVSDPEGITNRPEFARALTALRTRAGLTVRDVAKAAGIPFQTVGDYFGGRHLPPPTSDVLERVLRACGVDEPTAIAAWVEALRRVRRAPGPRPRARVTPYLGLAAFQPEHADWFFGRERLTEALLERLATADGLVVVVGASGSGKSSLLRAGLIPAVRAGRLASAAGPPGTWTIALVTPGPRPVAALAAALDEADNADGGLLVIIDQFEEVFAACPDEAERRAFLTALDDLVASGRPAGAGDAPRRPVALVAGLRADFYAHAVRYESLVAALQERQVVVGPMSAEELRRAIVEPARHVKAEVEAGLVELLLADLSPTGSTISGAHEAGALPMLSHALLSTWERGEHRAMTVAAYRASGGIADAVARTAEEVYDSLDDEQRERARGLFLRLVQVAPDMADTRRRVPLSELAESGPAELEAVVELFVQRRLLSADETHVEITHEALLRAWPRLVGWIDADRAGLRIHRQLTEAANAWQDSDRDDAALHRGTRLDLARDWAADPDHAAQLNPLEREFLDASVAHEAARRLAERRRTRRLGQLVAALGVLLLVAAGLGTFAAVESAARAHERDLAVSRQIAVTANELRVTDVALAAQVSLAGPTDRIEWLAFSPDGRFVAAASDDARAWLWDTDHPDAPGRPLTGHTNYIYMVAFSPDGRTVATASIDNTGRLWDVSDPQAPAPLGDPFLSADTYVASVAFSPDGRVLAAGVGDSTIRLFDVTDRSRPRPIGDALPGPHGYVLSVAFSPDSRTLAAGGSDGDVWLYDVAVPFEPERLARLDASTAGVYGLTFDPQRPTLLASSGLDRTVHLWETDPERVAAYICATAGDPVTEAEWARYVPGATLTRACLA